MDVEATRSIRPAEVGSTLTMLDRTAKRFDLRPDWLVADTAYGSEENLVELVLKRQILPFIPLIYKAERRQPPTIYLAELRGVNSRQDRGCKGYLGRWRLGA
jgi:hypothetical protein